MLRAVEKGGATRTCLILTARRGSSIGVEARADWPTQRASSSLTARNSKKPVLERYPTSTIIPKSSRIVSTSSHEATCATEARSPSTAIVPKMAKEPSAAATVRCTASDAMSANTSTTIASAISQR
eukprot:6182678-Pleurochrysis_carterae.AAC.1